jgi:hypothetical protein
LDCDGHLVQLGAGLLCEQPSEWGEGRSPVVVLVLSGGVLLTRVQVYVQEGIYDKFLAALKKKAETVAIGQVSGVTSPSPPANSLHLGCDVSTVSLTRDPASRRSHLVRPAHLGRTARQGARVH